MDELEEDDKDKEPKDLDDDLDGDIDDPLIPGKKKGKGDDLSLEDLGEEEDEVLLEDSFEDVDLW